MTKYEIILYWSNEDEVFIAEAPELAGCAADGATRQEALANVDTVIKGDTVTEVLHYVQYSAEKLTDRIRKDVERAVRAGKLSLRKAGNSWASTNTASLGTRTWKNRNLT